MPYGLAGIVVPPVGFLVYATLAITFRAIDPDELQNLLARLPTDRLAARL